MITSSIYLTRIAGYDLLIDGKTVSTLKINMAKVITPQLLNLLVCPCCKGPLRYDRDKLRLICRPDKLAFPIEDGVPMMMESAAIKLSSEELPK